MTQVDTETREITLPISGLPVVIRETDGYVDKSFLRKRLSEARYDYLAKVTERIGDISRVTTKQILDLLIPDQEFLAIESYRCSYGDDFVFTFICPQCGKGGDHEHHVNLAEMEIRPLSDETTGVPDPTVMITLPRSGLSAEVGMLTGAKEAIIMKAEENSGGADLNLSDYHSLRKLGGSPDFAYEDIVKLKGADHAAIRRARKKLICGYDTVVNVACPECGKRTRLNVLEHYHFFVPGA